MRFLYKYLGWVYGGEVGGTKPNNNRPVKKMSVHKIVLVISMINDLKGVFFITLDNYTLFHLVNSTFTNYKAEKISI